ncbi:hypothetical protein PRZ48_003513, partial [Zasmidium cellare]
MSSPTPNSNEPTINESTRLRLLYLLKRLLDDNHEHERIRDDPSSDAAALQEAQDEQSRTEGKLHSAMESFMLEMTGIPLSNYGAVVRRQLAEAEGGNSDEGADGEEPPQHDMSSFEAFVREKLAEDYGGSGGRTTGVMEAVDERERDGLLSRLSLEAEGEPQQGLGKTDIAVENTGEEGASEGGKGAEGEGTMEAAGVKNDGE